jgi:hypothetical protein
MWNYVGSNPINRLDPSGMCWVDVSGTGVWVPDASPQCRYGYGYPDYPDISDFAQLFGISFVNQWDDVDLEAARLAAMRVGQRFSISRGGGNPVHAFRQVYGINNNRPMVFTWLGQDCRWCKPAQCRAENNVKNKEYWSDDTYEKKNKNGEIEILYRPIQLKNGEPPAPCACKPKGGVTQTERSIEFASLWPNYTSGGLSVQQLRKINNIIHELGHAFNQRASQKPETATGDYYEIVKKDKFYLTNRDRGFYVDGYGTMTWVQTIETSGSEIFADMFIGWVYGKWAPDEYGTVRRNFMQRNMPNWTSSAIAKP